MQMCDLDDSRTSMVKELLKACRKRINEGDGHQALAMVLDAIRMTRGEGAIMEILDAAKKEADRQEEMQELIMAKKICNDLLKQETVLAERGDEGILVEAFQGY